MRDQCCRSEGEEGGELLWSVLLLMSKQIQAGACLLLNGISDEAFGTQLCWTRSDEQKISNFGNFGGILMSITLILIQLIGVKAIA